MKQDKVCVRKQKIKIAVIIPIAYRGGSVRGAISLANSLLKGARLLGDEIDVVFAHIDHSRYDNNKSFSALDASITRRSYQWEVLDKDVAKRALSYAGHPYWQPTELEYCVPDDGINQFLDCDLWIIISDRLSKPLLPIRPHVLMIYDYIQRYVPFLTYPEEINLIKRAQEAMRVLVTTNLTAQDAMQYAGIPANRVSKMPMLVPDFIAYKACEQEKKKIPNYFIWTTNVAKHKNHQNIFIGLCKYYDELGGQLECHVTGYASNHLLSMYPDIDLMCKGSTKMSKFVKFFGDLADSAYKHKLKHAKFLLHGALIDNGTFAVIEAAQLGVPALSSDYPPMREIDERFKLHLSWMNATQPDDIAAQLLIMEENYVNLQKKLLQMGVTQFQHTAHEESDYWKVIKECL